MGGVLTMAARDSSEPRRAAHANFCSIPSLQAHRQNGTATGSKHFATLRIEAHPTLQSAVARKSLQSRLAAALRLRSLFGLLKFRYGGASGSHRAASEHVLHA